MKIRIIGLIVLLFFNTLCLAQTKWTISDAYQISFSGKGADGTFSGLSGVIMFDPQNLSASSFDVKIDPSTIATGNSTKNKHARGDSWFDVEKYPVVSFQSSDISVAQDGYTAKGILTLHGVSLQSEINFTFEKPSDNKGIFKGSLVVNREKFGIEGPFISFMVGDDFEVNLTVPVVN